MRVLLLHGYLLRGTGSNVYNASLATALARLGHEVHLFCQDRDPPDLGAGTGTGSVTVHNPEIGGLLPVFVHDDYEGFEVKTFAELSDDELDRYLDVNVMAVREAAGQLGGFDAALANHLVMGPVILARAGARLRAQGPRLRPLLHRASRPRALRPLRAGGLRRRRRHPRRLDPHRRPASARPSTTPQTNAKVRLGPPGVDTSLFTPMPAADRRRRLEAAAQAVRGAPAGRGDRRRHRGTAAAPSAWDRNVDTAAKALEWFAEAEGPRVIFVGKLIVSKGVDLLLAAWPLVVAANPGARGY